MINKVIEIGRLVNGAAISYTPGGTCCARFSIAVNETYKDASGERAENVSFFDVVVWGKPAETLKPYLQKGKLVAIEGRLRQDRWTDKEGRNRTSVNIIAEQVQLLGGKNDGNGSQPAPQNNGGFTEDIPF